MRINRFATGACAAAILTAFAGTAGAASFDYEVHSQLYNPVGGNYQPSYITKDGNELTPPDDACGMRFEGDPYVTWDSYNGLYDENHNTGGEFDVWLPNEDCGAWQGVTIEGDNNDDWTVPYDFSGYLSTYATGFWINSDGEKLIYVWQCSPAPACFLGPQRFVANGWSEGLVKPIREAKLVLKKLLETTMTVSLVKLEQALAVGTRETSERINVRRGVHTGSLERPMRQLEDAAQLQVAEAQRGVASCKSALARGDRSGAYRGCSEALRNLESARSSLDNGDAWIQ
jgi:hypothetical protein